MGVNLLTHLDEDQVGIDSLFAAARSLAAVFSPTP
jgi:hypothetical protein